MDVPAKTQKHSVKCTKSEQGCLGSIGMVLYEYYYNV